jgi:phosphoribosylformylglycinamidine (FGAM) synthase-like enzyme
MSEENEYKKNKPGNFMKKWSEDEEIQLLKELKKNINIKKIAQIHDRSEGGIFSRCKEIAYNMYLKKEPIENIIKTTKLDVETINETIKNKKKLIEQKKNKDIKKNDMDIIVNEIINIKNIMTEYKCKIESLENKVETLEKESNILKKKISK